jgi:deoxyribodipyrimidine photo-lyase
MIECIEELQEELAAKGSKLFLFEGNPEEVVESCIKSLEIDAIIVNKDYTPYSQTRDAKISKTCKKHNVAFHSFEDLLLHPVDETLKKDGKPYTIFTPYFKNASKLEVAIPKPNKKTNYFTKKIPFSEEASLLTKLIKDLPPSPLRGGRSHAISILKKINSLEDYCYIRDFPSKNSPTSLSPYLKFTVCSPREVYAAICKKLDPNHDLIRSLYWRDFFTMIAFFFPHVFTTPFHEEYKNISWSNDAKFFTAWCEGKTGFPIVDAGMRELNATGFMHNRVRMIVASFLSKDLHIDWRLGEKYFANHLIDYDPAVNNGNWQWAASTGCDAQPYFRIFNPWNQQKKFDPDCIYIKKWIPELKNEDCSVIHGWENPNYHDLWSSYPPPIVSHTTQSKKAIALYKHARV